MTFEYCKKLNSICFIFYKIVKKRWKKITIKDNVKQLLSEDERCRNDDIYLILKYWQTYDSLQVDLSIFDQLTHTETIRRDRASIQNDDGLYPPTDPDVRKKREEKKKKSFPWFE